MTHADTALARRLESAEAANARGCTAILPDAAALDIAGGIAVFAGADSPLSQAVGMGLQGPVTESEICVMETFFRDRGARPAVELCPLADPSLIELLGRRGYRITEFNNVLVKRLAGTEFPATPRVRRAANGETDLWSHTVGHGFFERADLTAEEMDVGRAICAMPGALCYLATVEEGEPAGGAALAIHAGLATLFADSTIARHRRRGIHRELIIARLAEALAQSCDLATAVTLPGGASQRSYERLGFEVVYTRITYSL
jgi:GNAT superfamily N-acetyltransferase